jgi:hypothetical protein
MTTPRFFHFAVIALILAVCFGQFAVAEQKTHSHIMVVPGANPQARPVTAATPAAGLYPSTQGFHGTPYPNWINNSDGYELWPCFADSGNDGPNYDCWYLGYPMIDFPSHGGAFGLTRYTWPLTTSTNKNGVTSYGCDGTTNGTQVPYTQGETWDPWAIDGFYIPCGQIMTGYEDWTGDSTDEIIWQAVVTQVVSGVTVTIANTGIQDWGPNVYGSLTPPVNALFYQDFNFGALGQTGRNNGNCVPNFNYPTSGPPSSFPVITAANKTCVDPVAGPAAISVTTAIATPTWTCSKVCKVKYTKHYSLVQKWNINLE